MSTNKQFVFKNRSSALDYLERISSEILPLFKKLPKVSKYSEIEALAEPFESKVQEILSKYETVVGSNGYSPLGIRSLSPISTFRMNPISKKREIYLPVDFSIWASFEYGYVEIVFSNVFNNEKITREYYDTYNKFDPILQKVYDRIQNNYYAGSLRAYQNVVYFNNLHSDSNIEGPSEFLEVA